MLDGYVRLVFENSGSEFARAPGNCYVCGKDVFGSKVFREGLEKYILAKLPRKMDQFAADYCFLLGDCRPAENILLGLDGGAYSGSRSRYRLAEQDIKIDVRSFNRAADFVFSRFFRRKSQIPGNVFAISHTRLGSTTLAMFMENIFGKVNCREVEIIPGSRQCLRAANDDIEVSVKNKSRLNLTPDAK